MALGETAFFDAEESLMERGFTGMVFLPDPRGIEFALEAEPDGRVALRLEDDPGLGLPVRDTEAALGEGAVGVVVHRQPLGGVEQLLLGRRLHAGGRIGHRRGLSRLRLAPFALAAPTGHPTR